MIMLRGRIGDIKRLRNIKEIPWNWTKLSYNPHVTLKEILENMDVDWSWATLSSHLDFTEADLIHPGIPWDWGNMSGNPSLTLEAVGRLLYLPWNWSALSSNKFEA